jgi:coproporphyrinogen III oxidase
MKVDALKEEMEQLLPRWQDDICRAVEQEDGKGRFLEDAWKREGGGGGTTRVLSAGAVFEKAGVNTSVVHGELEEAFAKKLQGEGRTFYAAGLSLVLHPHSPLVPTGHANFRFIVQGEKAWFGGGADLTPWYLFEEDARHFHGTWKAVCDRHDKAFYPRFKAACDSYFWLKHRHEARGIGGIFFENMGGALEDELAFVKDCAQSFVASYVPIVQRRKAVPYTPEQRAWQEIRRGRYVEFNLVYDRGTVFGLETGGRTESILMSLPPQVRWVYDHHPSLGSEEERLVSVLQKPRDWA